MPITDDERKQIAGTTGGGVAAGAASGAATGAAAGIGVHPFAALVFALVGATVGAVGGGIAAHQGAKDKADDTKKEFKEETGTKKIKAAQKQEQRQAFVDAQELDRKSAFVIPSTWPRGWGTHGKRPSQTSPVPLQEPSKLT